MPKYSYTAHTINAEEISGTLSAKTQSHAIQKLKRKNLFPKEVTGTDLKLPTQQKNILDQQIQWPMMFYRISEQQLTVVTRQMATLIRAGLPLLRGLQLLERQQTNPRLKKAFSEISTAIEEGSSFTEALEQHPRIFNGLYINMIRAGEKAGLLDVVLERMATYMEKSLRVKHKILGALTYPFIILIASSGILIFLIMVIIPKFKLIFADLLDGQPLPPLTHSILNSSLWIRDHWMHGLCFITLLYLSTLALKRIHLGRRLLSRIHLSMPVIGSLKRTAFLAHFSRTLGTLMNAGIPILEAITIVQKTIINQHFFDSIQPIYAQIKDGDPMSKPVENNPYFPPIFTGIVEVGEESGSLPEMLSKTADIYEEDVDRIIATLSSIIEPLLILILALVVGTIVIAMFLPMVSIMGSIH